MKRTLLEITREILSDMEGDDVSSYTDTVESQQVAEIVRATYDQIISGRDWPHLYRIFRLTSTFSGTPTRMLLPENVMDIKFVKYNCQRLGQNRDVWTEIKYLPPQEFLAMTEARDSTLLTVTDWDELESGVTIHAYNDRPPTYYTSFYENALIFDSFDEEMETNMRSIQSYCYGKIYPSYTMADNLYFPLPVDAYPYFIEEAKSTAFATLKQMPNPKAEQHAMTHRRRMSQEKWIIKQGVQYPNYGRPRAK